MAGLEAFDVVTEIYKVVDGCEVKTDLLIPKGSQPGEHPLIINFHGGFLICFSRTSAPPRLWLLDHALEYSAIILNADYRLLPSVRGADDPLSDMGDLWTWIHETFPDILATRFPGHKVDLSRIMATGGSAGGYLAISLALSHPTEIKAVIAPYPMLDLQADFWSTGPETYSIGNQPMHTFIPESELPAEIQKVLDAGPISESNDKERVNFALSIVQHGFFRQLFDPDGNLGEEAWPLVRVLNGAQLPQRVWILLPAADSAVPMLGTVAFVNAARKCNASGSKIKLDILQGEDHGFDKDEAEWDSKNDVMKAGLDFVTGAWLTQREEA